MNTKLKENQGNQSKGLMGASLLSAFAASLCCITPILALFSGVSGLASSFSWMEPLRPVLVGVTILVLAFAWYQKLRKRTAEEIACECEDEKTPFLQTKAFLLGITVFSALTLTFPYYSSIFYPNVATVAAPVDTLKSAHLNIKGMTCEACESHIENAVKKLPGIVSVKGNHTKGEANVSFDGSKVTIEQIESAINETGYTVKKEEIKK